MSPADRYLGFWLWPVLDDESGRIDYWDVHDPLDQHGEGEPVAWGFGTKAEAQAWVRQHRADNGWIELLDRMADLLTKFDRTYETEACPHCHGTGFAAGSDTECGFCNV